MHDQMSYLINYVGLSVKTCFHEYELKSRLNMNSMGINVQHRMDIEYEMEVFTLVESGFPMGSFYASFSHEMETFYAS